MPEVEPAMATAFQNALSLLRSAGAIHDVPVRENPAFVLACSEAEAGPRCSALPAT
jgi:hypothetical protein